ncbi:hypothetical protein MTO98_23725 [Mucilaginibacter sp. SMC90]|uniref:PD-(D/E)XK nuclease domain-containing protein n=1 Tax=Mucilaginibacter sp. SMC90 TaxID=2929803 RepID=UPI001FB427E7|nr:hypothetical protein [Mucilaginibacter sp. SMC90]UOE47420.1 hypothetical protein MTO98_23725 [Mucilaginibacter sp. SMC90]
MNDLIPTINAIRQQLSGLMENYHQELIDIAGQLDTTTDYNNYFERIWQGGWARTDIAYYQNPNNQHQTIQVDANYFYDFLIKQTNTDVDELGKRTYTIIAEFKKLQTHALTELSLIGDEEKFANEVLLLEKVKDFKWGFESTAFIKTRIPNHMPVYDLNILSRGGLEVPPHLQAWGYIQSLKTKAVAPVNFSELLTQLLRQVELKLPRRNLRTDYTEKILFDVFENFHLSCRQLRNRHDNRPGFEVNDEYDVQDLMHAVLKLHFKDIREEEYTPSYAGSATRVDFLLKEEQVVIEVKKTRQGLADKQVGEQLILDIAHYRNHPDCKDLICFVYDPEGRIKMRLGWKTTCVNFPATKCP